MTIIGTVASSKEYDLGITMILLKSDGMYINVFSLDGTKVCKGDRVEVIGEFRERSGKWELYTKKVVMLQ